MGDVRWTMTDGYRSTCLMSFPELRGPGAARDENREGIALAARADADLDVGQPGVLQQPRQFRILEAKPFVAEPIANPVLFVLAQLEHEHASRWTGNAHGFGERLGRILRVMQRLRQQGDVNARVLERQLLQLAALPFDV